MFVLHLFFLLLFTWPSLHLLVRYLRADMDPKEKPQKNEIAGILVSTAGMVVYLLWLMNRSYFF